MDSSFISAAVQNIWNPWNIRGFMVLSLSMQLILAMTAPFRQKTSNGFFIFVVWSAYLLADWAALFAFGLISNAARQRNSNNNAGVAQDVMAFWAAFLLIHLGGPDAITAFSLEDNALWLRHLIVLIAQLFVFLYIFVTTLPHNKLLVPMMLIFVAGVIKYGERTRALYLASLENLRKSIKKTARSMRDLRDDSIIFGSQVLFSFHDLSKGLIVDITPNLSVCREIRSFILTPGREFTVMIFKELRLLYELLYTKIKTANSRWGVFARGIAYFSTLVALILFCLADKQDFHGVDIAITYALLGGVFILHVSNLLMLSTSYFHNPCTSKGLILWVFGQGFLPFLIVFALYIFRVLVEGSAIEHFLNREWSKKMGSFNLLSHCFKQGATIHCQMPGFLWNKLAEMRHTSREDFDPELFNFVFEDLKRKTAGNYDKESMRKVYEARGEWALEERHCHELKPYINKFEYDNTLLIWHVATEICYKMEGDDGDAEKPKILSKVLSDYMMYLLVKQPKLMSAVAGITHIRYEHTCVEAKLIRRKYNVQNMHGFCTKILEEHAVITESTEEEYSVLKDSCSLVRLIREKNNRWEVIFNVWMELLSYAAVHCRADSHARLLSEGGEFITFVWMLMALFGVKLDIYVPAMRKASQLRFLLQLHSNLSDADCIGESLSKRLDFDDHSNQTAEDNMNEPPRFVDSEAYECEISNAFFLLDDEQAKEAELLQGWVK